MLSNSVLLQAYSGKRPGRTPVWFMRQAGRYLPEYRALREKNSMLELIRSPNLAAEVTLQPLRRFNLDAAIIFADILNPLIGMGLSLDFVKGEGPKISNPVRSLAQAKALKLPPPSENVSYTLEAIQLVAAELSPRDIPVIGFSGSPFTLSCYAIEGQGDGSFSEARKVMFADQKLWVELNSKLAELVSAYLLAQVKAGASAVQLFDSWAGLLSAEQYRKFAFPFVERIITAFKASSKIPFCYFSTGTHGILPELAKLPADLFGIDWRCDLVDASKIFDGRPIQGNLDPLLFFGKEELLKAAVLDILEQGAKIPVHIFNVGHGITPLTPIERVEYVINLVRDGR